MVFIDSCAFLMRSVLKLGSNEYIRTKYEECMSWLISRRMNEKRIFSG
ncbi:protein of unknown function [Vibrio tapetis subsp. tapetis]|uniref:Uncharacterized protein n=1 Tax=Vibrio tapetis subsp. tapetis TaxID=1671868 RepID=A0A2N8ZMJ9_9VIBR|nr:protein of unknown function [Vibrio tapetis subsp. tapetis]